MCLVIVSSSFSQEARKIAELGYEQCSYFNALVDSMYEDYKRVPDSRLYVIYYEQKGYLVYTNNSPRKKKTVWVNPRKGDALSKAKEIEIYLKSIHNLPDNQINYIDGGFRERFTLEVYLLLNGAVPPKPTPTISEKDIVFRKGKPRISRDCSKTYGMYP